MTGCSSAAAQALFCFDCICITWLSLIGLVMPVLVALVYLPRVLREASMDDWLILVFATTVTYASKKVSAMGVAHEPWYLYIVAMWGILACTTDRTASLRSIPLVGVLTFCSLVVPDVLSMVISRPDYGIGIPGGRGPIDGLVLKPAMAMGITSLAYWLKIHPLLPNQTRRQKTYDAKSRDFLLNLHPGYKRPRSLDAFLVLVQK
jgi:hypothetical protein